MVVVVAKKKNLDMKKYPTLQKDETKKMKQ